MWEVAHAWVDTDAFRRLLSEGWEPFAVDPPGAYAGHRVWFKRQKK